LEALKEFSELGSGFRLAMKDLEIRGAGHLFGERQHGVMEAVGYDYFIHLLEQAIRELKGEAAPEARVEIRLRVDNRVPESYLPEVNLRMDLYKRVSSAERPEDLDALRAEIQDRFGPPPPGVDRLFDYGRVKILAARLRILSVDRSGSRLILKFDPAADIPPERITGLLKTRGGTLTPEGVLSLNLRAKGDSGLLHETIGVLKALYGM
jgi:transcription-repair coupling factor (superfamily II helicase)